MPDFFSEENLGDGLGTSSDAPPTPAPAASYSSQTPQDNPSGVQRGTPDTPEQRIALVKEWCEKVRADKKHWEPVFKRMREDQAFVSGRQWGSNADDARYVANITQRHVKQTVAALYAKNPRVVAKRRKTLDFAIWDEKPATLQAAMETAQTPLDPMSPIAQQAQMAQQQAMELLHDAEQGIQRRALMDRIARTMVVVHDYYIAEQDPPFKKSMKQLVRRTVVNGVGYVKLCFHRQMEAQPEVAAKVSASENRIAEIDVMRADLADGETDGCDAELEQLRIDLEAQKAALNMVVKEGTFYDYPRSTEIIPSKDCRDLKGFVGAGWVTQEYILSPKRVQAIYGVDIGYNFTAYREGSASQDFVPRKAGRDGDDACVWEIYSRDHNLKLVVVDGYPDFLVEPAEPDVFMERFYPWFALTFNECEDEKDIYPKSDVHLIRPMQMELNRTRQGLREHRLANRPRVILPYGKIEDADKEKVQECEANSLIELKGVQQNEDVSKIFQAFKGAPIDPNLYETNELFQDIQRVVGVEAATAGGGGDGSATESAIDEASRMSSIGSNVDDLDDLLTEMAKATGQVLLLNVSVQTVQKIAGPGAVWPEMTRAEVAGELYLEIAAASSGRPNKALEVQNFVQLAPILQQIPGISPDFLLAQAVMRLDDSLDVTDALLSGMPSISALNSMMVKNASAPGGSPQAAAAGVTNGMAAATGRPPAAPQQPGANGTPPHMQGPAGQHQAPAGHVSAAAPPVAGGGNGVQPPTPHPQSMGGLAPEGMPGRVA